MDDSAIGCEEFDGLRVEASRFRTWASAYPVEGRFGEWETLYESWTALEMAFQKFVRACPTEEWNREAIDTVLYVLARNNESTYLASELAKSPSILLFVAHASLSCDEPDARWQMAWKLGDAAFPLDEVEPILLAFTEDADEYVRQRALMALGRLKSGAVERIAEQAWNRDDPWQEYQRMAALDALWRVGSPLLTTYLNKADEDGRPHLVAFAVKVRAGKLE